MFIPTCDGGSELCFYLHDKREVRLTSSEPPMSFIFLGKSKITRAYAQHVRAQQPIKRGLRLLMTKLDRDVLLCALWCMRCLPKEIREFVLGFLNMSHLPYVAD